MNRAEAPKFYQAEDLKLIFPKKIELNNGIALYWMKDVKDASVKLDLVWNAGSKYQSNKLVASFTNKLLLAGNDQLKANTISENIDFHGGFTSLECDKDHASITIYGLNNKISEIFSVFANAFANAQFPDQYFEKERQIAIDKFKVNIQKVKTLARRSFNEEIFGSNSKYGMVADEVDFKNLNAQQLRDFYQTFYLSNQPTIFLTGEVDETFISELKNWSSLFVQSQHTITDQGFEQTKGRIDVKKEGAIQSAIRVGRLMFDKTHEDYYHFQLMNTILGGYFGSRLMANIREDKGYTYGIGSGMVVLQDAGYFFVSTEVGVDVKENTLNEIYHEFDQLRNVRVDEDELTRVKNYMFGEFLRNSDGPIQMMESFKNIYYNNLADTYYSDFIAAIHEATPERLQELANKYLIKEEMLEIVAG